MTGQEHRPQILQEISNVRSIADRLDHAARIPNSEIPPLARRSSLELLVGVLDREDGQLQARLRAIAAEAVAWIEDIREKRSVPLADEQTIDPYFGSWLAGFVDGEGCFTIKHHTSSFGTQFSIELRADDAAVLEQIRDTLGIGSIHRRDREGRSSFAAWVVSSKADCERLVAILDRFPLRSKKAADYSVWRNAVLIRASEVDDKRAQLGVLKDRLQDVRSSGRPELEVVR